MFGPQKSRVDVIGGLRASSERRPNRSSSIQSICGNDASLGRACVRLPSFWVTPDSDVTLSLKIVANAGSSAAAGVVPGAWSSSARYFKRRRVGVWPQ